MAGDNFGHLLDMFHTFV